MRRIIISETNSSSLPPEIKAGIIPLAAEPIRQIWIKRYRLLEKKLEKLKKDWRLFEEDAHSQFQKWYYSTFAAELSRVEEWHQKSQEQQTLLAAVVAHQRIYNLDELEAYARVREKLDAGEDPFPPQAELDRYQKKQQEREEAEMKRRAQRAERLRKEAEEFWSSKAEEEEFREAMESLGDAPPSERKEKPEPSLRHSDLKTTYRSIVRELHPDLGHEMSAIEKEWWNQAQVAYRNSDLELLKMIALKIHGRGVVPIEKIFHIGTIIDLCASIVEQQDQIKVQQRSMRKDPVYRFWSSRDRPSNRESLKIDLLAKIHQQQRSLRNFLSQVRESFQEFDYQLRRHYWQNDEVEEESSMKQQKRGRGRGRSRGR